MAATDPAFPRSSLEEACSACRRFVESARSPRVLEFGEPAITVSEERLRLEVRGRWLSFEAWEEGRFLSRRVVRIKSQSRDRLELVVERFGGHKAVLTLFDAARPSNDGLRQKGKRQAFGAVFRRMLQREFPDWRIHELSTDANLQESLSPAHPRAMLRRGNVAIAAIAAPPGSDVDAALSFGLIWLDYLRRREQGAAGTARCGHVLVHEAAGALDAHGVSRLRVGIDRVGIDRVGVDRVGVDRMGVDGIARHGGAWQGDRWQGDGRQGDGRQGDGWQGDGWQGDGWQEGARLWVSGGEGTQLGYARPDVARPGVGGSRTARQEVPPLGVARHGVAQQGVREQGVRQHGVRQQGVRQQGVRQQGIAVQGLAVFLPQGREHTTRLRMRWLDPQAAHWMLFGFDESGHSAPVDLRDCGNLDTDMEQAGPPAASCGRLNPEAVIEDQVRSQIRQIDAGLRPEPVYGQVPAFAGCDRGIMDLLGISYEGRLTIVELKASESVHLPLQALDYWIRVQWHLERGDFPRHGYFPGVALSKQAPRLLLVAPAMRFHSTNERVVRFFDPRIEVEMVGVAPGWTGPVRVLCRDKRQPGVGEQPRMAIGSGAAR